MNPFDAVGTARIAGAVYDRVCRVAMGYQSAEDERSIVESQHDDVPAHVQSAAVEIVRATREHPDLRTGSSIRGAIDLCAVARELAELRSLAVDNDEITLDAALVALSGTGECEKACLAHLKRSSPTCGDLFFADRAMSRPRLRREKWRAGHDESGDNLHRLALREESLHAQWSLGNR